MKHLLLTTIAAVLVVGCGPLQYYGITPGRLIAPAPPSRGIWRAADQGNIEAVKKHLDAGVDIHVLDKKYGFAPLHYAAEGGYKEIVELLLAKGADVNQRDKIGKTPTYWAMRYGRKEVTAILRKHGGKTEIELAPKTSIWNAVAANNIEFVKELLISGEDVNAKVGLRGGSPLHATGMFGRKECAEFLIAKGADVNAKDDRGETALDWAMFAYDWEQPEVKAAKKEAADLLRKHGGKHGTICGAAGGGDVEAVKEFLAAGADVNIRDKSYHKTPLDWAVEHDKTQIADLLRKHGGKTGKELRGW